MKNVEKHLVGWLSICLLLCSFPVWAQGDAGDYLTIVDMVKDKQNKKALENVNVSVHGSNIGTVTNAEGEFALKIKKTEAPNTGTSVFLFIFLFVFLSCDSEIYIIRSTAECQQLFEFSC